VSNDLKCTEHVRAVTSKASSHLHFLKQLKRAGCAEGDLTYFYISVVRPILEYACLVLHTGLTAAQSDALESVQKRAMRIIYSDDNSGDYKTRIIISGIDTLKDRREVVMARYSHKGHDTIQYDITLNIATRYDMIRSESASPYVKTASKQATVHTTGAPSFCLSTLSPLQVPGYWPSGEATVVGDRRGDRQQAAGVP